jgi:hypothetical protein
MTLRYVSSTAGRPSQGQPLRRGSPTRTQRLVAALREEDRVTNDSDGPVGFDTHVKPMFRERDQRAMNSFFDLWSHDDVSQHADAILRRLRDGTMPCDGAWPADQVDLFQRWVESGKPQ